MYHHMVILVAPGLFSKIPVVSSVEVEVSNSMPTIFSDLDISTTPAAGFPTAKLWSSYAG